MSHSIEVLPLPEAGATQERTLLAVGSMPLFGWVSPCAPLADHLVGQEQERRGNRDPERLGGLQVDDKVELRRRVLKKSLAHGPDRPSALEEVQE